MDAGRFRTRCLALPGTTEDQPFGEDVVVFRVCGKIFAMINLARLPLSVNLKADPERSAEWRERYADVTPGYHMNKRLWNTVVLAGEVPSETISEMIDHSYDEVVRTLKRAEREALA